MGNGRRGNAALFFGLLMADGFCEKVRIRMVMLPPNVRGNAWIAK